MKPPKDDTVPPRDSLGERPARPPRRDDAEARPFSRAMDDGASEMQKRLEAARARLRRDIAPPPAEGE